MVSPTRISLDRLSPLQQAFAKDLLGDGISQVKLSDLQAKLKELDAPKAGTKAKELGEVEAKAWRAGIKELIGAVYGGGQAVSVRAGAQRAEANPVYDAQEVTPHDTQLLAAFDKVVIGQPRAKMALLRLVKSLERTREVHKLDKTYEGNPKCLFLNGPPGNGKSTMGNALAYALHGDESTCEVVDVGNIKDTSQLNRIFGAPPGYAGYDPEMKDSPLAPSRLDAKFGNKVPKIITFDEVDKMPPDVAAEFWDMVNKLIEHGEMTLSNGQEVKMKDTIFLFTANEGVNTAGAKSGEALDQHYVDAAMNVLKAANKANIISRIRNFVSTDPLKPEELEQITALVLNRSIAQAETIARKRGLDVSFEASPEVAKLLAEVGYTPSTACAR
ncbi:MAG: ATP-dependent Clp protease ATP-binding subunit [Archangiaceae bacterium]|nr:ATP-dependent Clp protease ATP-binding subunit [Archangiaceae bacterium]